MARIALLTPAAHNPYVRAWRDAFDRLAAALGRAGLDVQAIEWPRAPQADADLVMPLLAWGYHQDAADWLAMLEALQARGARVLNDVGQLRWNTTKAYLAELGAAGVPVVPTVFADRLDEAVVAEARARLGAETVVVKPQVSAGSHATLRLDPGDPLEGGPDGPAMIQPFLPAVSGEGEISLVCFGGVFSHAVGKVAKAGDFRVQPQFGAAIGPIAPPSGALEVARAALAAAPGAPTYARVDLIRHPDGALRVMELEAIEPDLFLEHAPDAGAAFAAAVKAALQGDPRPTLR
ncbi:MAG: ATP-grasp domain-containing protein [Pseudomonadota bacterium]